MISSRILADTSWFKLLLQSLDLDFFRTSWTTVRGTILEKKTDTKFSTKNALPGVGSTYYIPRYVFVVFTSKGNAELEVPEGTFDCMSKSDSIPVDVQVSRIYPDRIRLRLVRND